MCSSIRSSIPVLLDIWAKLVNKNSLYYGFCIVVYIDQMRLSVKFVSKQSSLTIQPQKDVTLLQPIN